VEDVRFWVAEGGIGAYALLACACGSQPFALLVPVIAFVRPTRQKAIALGSAAMAIGMMTIAIGAGAYFWNMWRLESFLALVEAERAGALREGAREEAMHAVWIAIFTAILPFLFGLLALLRGVMLPGMREAGGR
jgi:hypothetical protein